MLLLVVALGACGKRAKDDGPTCRQIVSYMMRFKEFGAFDERSAIAECRKQRWTAAQRKCLYTAKGLDDMMTCIPPMKVDRDKKRRLPLPEWHPNLDEPLRGSVTPDELPPAPVPPPAAPPKATPPEPAPPTAMPPAPAPPATATP